MYDKKKHEDAVFGRTPAFYVLPAFILFYTVVFGAISCKSPPKTIEPAIVVPVEEVPAPVTESFIKKLAALLNAGDINGALALFDTLSPEDAELRHNRRLKASVLFSAGRLPEARFVTETLINEDDTDIESRFILSEIEAASGKIKEQRLLLEKIIKDEPVYVPALNKLGQIFINAKSLKQAAVYFGRAITADPLNMNALHGRDNVYRIEHDAEKAEELFNKAVDLYPERSEPYSERGRFYREAGKLTQGLSDLDKAKKIDPDNYWISYDRGRILLEMQMKPEALLEFDNANRLAPGTFISYVYSAGIRDELGDIDGAEHDFETLIRLRPDYYFALEGLGIQKMKKGLYTDAAKAFAEAYQKAPEENSYAILTAVNMMRSGSKPNEIKSFVEPALKKIDRNKLDYHVLRLFFDFSGEADVARRIDKEKNQRVKAQMLFYLANYYDLRGSPMLADKFFIEVRDMKRMDMIEWRINEWILEQRNIQLGRNNVNGRGSSEVAAGKG
jgi:tetratricopeptide (TPR) repeat protein